MTHLDWSYFAIDCASVTVPAANPTMADCSFAIVARSVADHSDSRSDSSSTSPVTESLQYYNSRTRKAPPSC